MNERRAPVSHLYKSIHKLDSQIIALKKRESVLIQKISKGKDFKKKNQYVDLVEESIEETKNLEKKKAVLLSTMADLTPMVRISLLEDPFIEEVIYNGSAKKEDLASNYLYGCIDYGYTIFSKRRIPTIQQKMTLDEFENRNIQGKSPKTK